MADVDLGQRARSKVKQCCVMQFKGESDENETNRTQRCLSYRFEVVIAKNLVVE